VCFADLLTPDIENPEEEVLEEEMAFSPENQKWVKDEINSAIHAHLGPPGRAEKILRGLRDWGLTGTMVAVPLALLAGVITLGIRVTSDVRDEATFRSHTEDRLKAIEAGLNALNHPSPLQSFVNMDQTRLSRNLSKVAEAAREAQQDGVLETIANLSEIQTKVASLPLTQESSPAFWSLINYASFVREKTSVFPNAAVVSATTCNLINIGNGGGPRNSIVITLDGVKLRGCALTLDGLSLKNSTISNAVVRYFGGALRLDNVRFVNCVFEAVVTVKTTQPAQSLARQILAKNIGAEPIFTVSVG
jgi:hypothetical protein